MFEEVAENFQSFPWWAGTSVGAFLILFSVVAPHLPFGGSLASRMVLPAQILLWAFAAAVLLYTASGVIRRRLDRHKFDRTTDLGTLGPYEFERYVAEYYRRRGYLVTQRGGRGPDGGVDLVIENAEGRLIVQCKHWKVWRVPVTRIRELWGLVDHEKAAGAVFVTSGVFTNEARAFARGKRLELVDGAGLRQMVAEVRASSPAAAAAAVAPASQGPIRQPCPSCGAPMVLRTARRGPQAGGQFWGCSTFPAWPLHPGPSGLTIG